MLNADLSKDALAVLMIIRTIHGAKRGTGVREHEALMMSGLPIEQFIEALEELDDGFLIDLDKEGEVGCRWIDLTHKGEVVRTRTV